MAAVLAADTGLNGGMVRTVMVVEDDDAIRLVLRTNLEDEGYRVVEPVTAEQALLLMIDERADVVLVDLRLPGLSSVFTALPQPSRFCCSARSF